MTPIRTVAPTEPVVEMHLLKSQCSAADFADDDALIQFYHDAAVAHLDGYRGVLGRCIMPQTWQVTYAAPGTHRLPFPGVQTVAVDVGTATLSNDSLGSLVTLSEAATVSMVARCPEDILPAVKLIVMMTVATWYAERKATGAANVDELPLTVSALLAPIRWVRV